MPIQMPTAPPSVPRSPQEGEITGWRIRLYYWTRNPHVLIWTAVLIIAAGCGLGKFLEPEKGSIHMPSSWKAMLAGEQKREEPTPDLVKELTRPELSLERVLRALEARDTEDSTVVANALNACRLKPEEKRVALAYWSTLCSTLSEPGADLIFLAHQPSPPPFANGLVGDYFAINSKKTQNALRYYERELAIRPTANDTRESIVELHWGNENFAALHKLKTDPAYAAYFTNEMKLMTAMRQHDWAAIWEPLIALQKQNFSHRIPVILTVVAGGVWLLLALQIAQPQGLFSFRVLAPLVAIPLGIASTLPVLFLDAYQREAWGLEETGSFFKDCYFFIAGVGLREEFCKWLLFLPLAPFVILRGNRLEMLIVAGAVGLGFAIEDNVSYFMMSTPAEAFGRFLTANFFHFAATGLIGLAFCDSVRNFRSKWWKFPAVFVVIVAAHGFYDAFLSAPLVLFRLMALSCFILLSLAFFRQAARERGRATDQIFPAATLIIGLAVLVATIIACASVDFGFEFAIDSVWTAAISLGLMIYMFFVLFRDGLDEDEEIIPNCEPL